MWEKLRIRDHDRIRGALFLTSLLAFLGFCLLALGFPNAAMVTGACFLLTVGVMIGRGIQMWLQCRSARAPVGPLSLDEKLKARSKLTKPRQNIIRPPAPSALT